MSVSGGCGCPFKTDPLPLSYNGNPGGMAHLTGGELETLGSGASYLYGLGFTFTTLSGRTVVLGRATGEIRRQFRAPDGHHIVGLTFTDTPNELWDGIVDHALAGLDTAPIIIAGATAVTSAPVPPPTTDANESVCPLPTNRHIHIYMARLRV